MYEFNPDKWCSFTCYLGFSGFLEFVKTIDLFLA